MVRHISRRSFLAGTLSVAAAASAPVVLAERAAAATAAFKEKPALLRRSAFTPLLGSTFRMSDTHSTIPVVLAEIGDVPVVTAPGDENRFSLLFTAPAGPKRPQGTYRMQHPRLGEVSLFVVPVGRGATSPQYQAIINRR